MIDLHCHSKFSDGEFEPNTLLRRAEKLGLSYFSITDHNNCFAYENINKELFKGRLITGVELATSFDKQIIEILGYGMDIDEINNWRKYEEKKEPEYAKIVYDRLIEIFEKNNIYYSKNLKLRDKIDNTFETGTIKQLIYNDLIKYKENKSIITDELKSYSNFNKNGLNNPNSMLFINEYTRFLDLHDAVDMIHRNGGLCFLAHVYQYNVNDHLKFLDNILDIVKLDGLEVYHSSFSKEQIEQINKYANKHSLYKSGGSDFHGILKPDFKLGMDMQIPNEIISPWINKIKCFI